MSRCDKDKPSFLDESHEVLLIDPEDTLIVPGIDENAFIKSICGPVSRTSSSNATISEVSKDLEIRSGRHESILQSVSKRNTQASGSLNPDKTI